MEVRKKAGGDSATNDAYTGPERQITVDTDSWHLRVHDEITPGGHVIPNENMIATMITAAINSYNTTVVQVALTGVQAELTTIKADGWVTTNRLANTAVTSGKLANSAVNINQIADGSITTTKLANSAVTTAKILDGNVTRGKLASTERVPQGPNELWSVTLVAYTANIAPGYGGTISGASIGLSGTWQRIDANIFDPWTSNPGLSVGLVAAFMRIA